MLVGFLITEQFQAPLSQAIQKEYNKLIEVMLQIPEKEYTKKIIDGTGGKISIIELVAYQIGWGKLLLSWYEAGLKGAMPDMPGEGFTKWDYVGLAKHFYKKYSYNNFDQQIKEFNEVVKYIIAVVEIEYQKGNLDMLGVWAWCTLSSGKLWPLSKWVRVNTVAPYKRAINLIKKYFKD